MTFRRALIALAAFALGVVLQGSAPLVAAADEPASGAMLLSTQSFWKAPAGEEIVAITAYPNGDLAVETVDEPAVRHFYRVDPDGRTLWQQQLEAPRHKEFQNYLSWPPGEMVSDDKGGLFFCGNENAVEHLDAAGRFDRRTARQMAPTGASAETTSIPGFACQKIVVLADGSTIVAGVDSGNFTQIRVARVNPSGRIAWVNGGYIHSSGGEVKAMLLRPDGNIEILFDPLEPDRQTFNASFRDQLAWQWRISPNGKWLPATEMGRRMPPLPYAEVFDRDTRMPTQWTPRVERQQPPGSDWYEVEALYRSGDRLVRAGLHNDWETCQPPIEEWSLDGEHLLARYELAPPVSAGEKLGDAGRVRHLGRASNRDILMLECVDAQPFIAAIDTDRSARWYRADRPFDVTQGTVSADGKHLYLLADPTEIISVEVPYTAD